MKTLKTKIKKLIKNKIIDGETEQDYKIFSDIFDHYLNEQLERSLEEEDVIKHLHSVLIREKEEQEKLNDINKINYFGEYLFFYIRHNDITYEDICDKIEVNESLLHRIINNKIKIFDISPTTLAKLVKYLNLKIELVNELLVKTILINYGKISAKNTLARYSKDKGLEEKGKSMSSAVNELLLKAHSSKPISNFSQDLDRKTEIYLAELKKELNAV